MFSQTSLYKQGTKVFKGRWINETSVFAYTKYRSHSYRHEYIDISIQTYAKMQGLGFEVMREERMENIAHVSAPSLSIRT